MKLRIIVSLFLLSLIAAIPAIKAQDKEPMTLSASPKKEDKTELGKAMDKMGKALRALKKQVADPAKNASSLQLAEGMRSAALASADLTPAKAQDLPEADRAQFEADYKAGMKDLLGAIDDLAAALKAGDNDQAVKIVQGFNKLMKDGHKKFQRPKTKES